MMNKRFTHIFFDLDNTLWDFKNNSRLAMESAFHHYCLNEKIDFTTFFHRYTQHNDRLWTAYRNKEVGKKELKRLRFQLTFDDCKVTGVDALEMNASYLNEMPRQTLLIEGAVEVLEYLKKKGYKLHVITNGFKEVQLKKLQNSGLNNYFDKVFISEEIKCPKPGKEIFEHAIKSTNARKTQSLMIGDDWEVDVMGAKKIGIDAMYYSQNNRSTDKHNQDVIVLAQLAEIRRYL